MKRKILILVILAMLFTMLIILTGCEYDLEKIGRDYSNISNIVDVIENTDIVKDNTNAVEENTKTVEENTNTVEENTKTVEENTNTIEENTTEKIETSKEIPISIKDGFDLLQSFYMYITEDYSIEEVEMLAKQCGLYCYKYNGGTGFMNLQIATSPYINTSYGSEKYIFDCDYLWIIYDSISGSYSLSHSYYNFINTPYNICYNTHAKKWDDSLETMVDDYNYYNINRGVYAVDPTERFYNAEETFKKAKNMVENYKKD